MANVGRKRMGILCPDGWAGGTVTEGAGGGEPGARVRGTLSDVVVRGTILTYCHCAEYLHLQGALQGRYLVCIPLKPSLLRVGGGPSHFGSMEWRGLSEVQSSTNPLKSPNL